MTDTKAPVVFIHGLWLHATSWAPWQELFAESGYEAVAPGWPGDADTVHATREIPDSVANHGIDDVTEHYGKIIDGLDAPPILIGHSFGGLIAEKLLGMNRGAAAIAIDAAQIKGVLQLPLSQLRGTLSIFANPSNKHKEFRYSFGNALSEEESNALYERWTIPSPARPLFEAASAAFSPHSPAKVDTANDDRGPLLLTMGGKDHTVPEAITKSTLKQYKHSGAVTDLVEFSDRGHSLTIDSGWREVAEACLGWLNKQGR
jgi:alpha-beta hydrolase superfamily lysophospholipase